MPLTLIILGAALLHATWNALLRSTADRKHGMLVINIVCPLIVVPLILFLPLPPATAWQYLLLSGLFNSCYNIFLVKAYEHGELSQVYPVARGISPMLVTIGALLVAGERPDPRALLGICLISGGIIALAEMKHHTYRKAFISAVITGCFIAAYTVTDGMGIRQGGDVLAYNSWRSFITTVFTTLFYLKEYRVFRMSLKDRETQKAVYASILALLGYAIVVWAMKMNPMGSISALRETSVVFATFIGCFFLKEKLTYQLVGACGLIAIGMICLA